MSWSRPPSWMCCEQNTALSTAYFLRHSLSPVRFPHVPPPPPSTKSNQISSM